MSERAVIMLVRATAVIAVALAIVGSAVLVTGGHFELMLGESGVVFGALFALFFGVLAGLVIRRHPQNAVIWVMAISAFFWSVYVAGTAAFTALFPGDPRVLYGPELVPADLPSDAAWVVSFTFLAWVPALFVLTTLGLLLFPDGKLPSPRWRWVALLSIFLVVIGTLAGWWTVRPQSTIPYNVGTFEDPAAAVIILGGLALSILSLVALAGRFRRSRGETRQQFKWVVWGALVFVVAVLPAFFLQGTGLQGASDALFFAAGAVLLGSYGIAVGKYRLFDIDVVISRTFVYGSLAVFITVVYVATVVGVGQLIGSGDAPNPVLAIGATAAVAVAFQPLRRRLQTTANRLVYGRRATPYEVLSTFSQRVAAVDPNVLTQIAEALVEGTTADAAGVWMTRGAEMQLMAQWPANIALPKRRSTAGDPDFGRVATVTHDGERLGLVTLSFRPGQAFTPVDAELLDQVAAGLGLVLRNLRLTEDLKDRLDQLRESRRRIVAVQDATRRRLERDLHDGAQQRLVSLKIKLGIGSTMATKAGLDDVRQVLDTLRVEADETIEAVRDFARGIYSPLLEAEGIGAALTSRAHKLSVPVTVQAAGVARYPRELEATVYFCVIECLQNAAKHSKARSVLVTLSDGDGDLSFEVRDDGVGFDVEQTPRGLGLTNIADRLDAMDGTFEATSEPGRGTVVRGAIPTRERAVAG